MAIRLQSACSLATVLITAVLGLSSCQNTPDPALNGAWQDPATGLIWQRCSIGQVWSIDHCEGVAEELTWWKAVRAAHSNNWNAQGDWRLPTLAELETLGQTGKKGYKPAAQMLDLPAPNYVGTYWSSSLYPEDTTYAVSYLYNLAQPHNGAKSYSLYVRLVRAGKPDQQYASALSTVDQDEISYLKGS